MNIKIAAFAVAAAIVVGSNVPAMAAVGATGQGSVNNQVAVELALGCNSTGSEVSLGANGRRGQSLNLEIKLAFANPSVSWDSGLGFIKKSGKSTIVPVTDGSELTTIPLTVSANGFSKGQTNRGMGNPYVYYNDGDSWELLGRCNSPTQQSNGVLLNNAAFDFNGSVIGNTQGPCFTNTKSSKVNFGGRFSPGNASFSASAALVYSNKILDNSNGGLKVGGESVAGIGKGQTFDRYGYHVSGDSISLGINTSELADSYPFGQRDAVGIGGNPNVWLKAGNGAFVLQGRCNNL
ncbi:MAG: hypothetical protein ACKOXT_04340 [Actinomycetota bacterium]